MAGSSVVGNPLRPVPGARVLVPETIQISQMDCGPAALHSLLAGFDLPADLGRLREVCNTSVDGTSIDTLEQVAVELGLDAEQVIVPVDHLLMPSTELLPALVVVRSTAGDSHFIVVWKSYGRFVQVMDPGRGRYWTTAAELTRKLYVHQASVDAAAWRAFAETDTFRQALTARLRAVGDRDAANHVAAAYVEDDNRAIAALDAATRLTESLVETGGLTRGGTAGQLAIAMAREAARTETGPAPSIPESFWFGWREGASEERETGGGDEGDSETMAVRGAVIVRIAGRRAAAALGAQAAEADEGEGPTLIDAAVLAQLRTPSPSPMRELLRELRADGVFAPSALVLGIMAATLGVALEAVVFRGLLDLGRRLAGLWSRTGGALALLALLLALFAVEAPLGFISQRIGWLIEGRLRVRILAKIPRLADRYLSSRPLSDMASRSHALSLLGRLGAVGAAITQTTFELIATAVGIAWLDPVAGAQAVALVVVTVAISYLLQPALVDAAMRVYGQASNLSRFYLDAMQGLVVLRAHGAERALRYVYDETLERWREASYSRVRTALLSELLLAGSATTITTWLVLGALWRAGDPRSLLLLLFWALNLPPLAVQLAQQLQDYPNLRVAMVRLLEPLTAPDEETLRGGADADLVETTNPSTGVRRGGVAIQYDQVSVEISGHSVLSGVDLQIAAGSHVAIVGASGAGKSTLVGLLQGWYEPSTGEVLVDGARLVGSRLAALRRITAWINPEVALWNRTLLDNLEYGAPADGARNLRDVLDDAELLGVLERMPEGMQTMLGEGGALVSGGEGQRVRLARAMRLVDARLVIMDEPFRGLERDRRRALLARAREQWRGATLMCVTHDVEAAADFDRVIVVERGQVVEDDSPAALLARPNGVYRRLRAARDAQLAESMTRGEWRRVRIENGVLVTEPLRERPT